MFLLILLMPLKLSVRNYLNKSMKIAEKFKEELSGSKRTERRIRPWAMPEDAKEPEDDQAMK